MSKRNLLIVLSLFVILLIGGLLFWLLSPRQNTDWTCIAGQKAGPITRQTTEARLKRIFGAENVTSQKQVIKEGAPEVMTTFLFKGTPNELEIRWVKEQVFKEIAGVIVNNPGSRWKTPEGITVGDTLEQLTAINKKPIQFLGFEWDKNLGGWVLDWGGGVLHDKKIGANLKATVTHGADYLKYSGQVEISSDDPALAKFKIIISRLFITL